MPPVVTARTVTPLRVRQQLVSSSLGLALVSGCAARAAPRAIEARTPTTHRAPTVVRRVDATWPLWLDSGATAQCDRVRRETHEARAPIERTADAGVYDYAPEEWIFGYPLGPLSTGVGFAGDGYRRFEALWTDRLIARAGASRTYCHGAGYEASSADGVTSCETQHVLRALASQANARRCAPVGQSVSVLVDAVLTPEGTVIPEQASTRAAHISAAECIARALVAQRVSRHEGPEGARTVLAFRWYPAACARW
jgi:hypothetical protein